jgi:hypothetical protein
LEDIDEGLRESSVKDVVGGSGGVFEQIVKNAGLFCQGGFACEHDAQKVEDVRGTVAIALLVVELVSESDCGFDRIGVGG